MTTTTNAVHIQFVGIDGAGKSTQAAMLHRALLEGGIDSEGCVAEQGPDHVEIRPVFHRLDERVKAHVLICMLACYLTWHLRAAWPR
jgi:thymidylate kinase